MWNENALTRRLGIEYPIVQGPFGGGASSVALTATVSNAGGLGSFGMQSLDHDQMIETGARIRAATSRPFAVNLWIPKPEETDERYEHEFRLAAQFLEPYFRELGAELPEMPRRFLPDFGEQLAALRALRPPVFSFVYGVPSPEILKDCKTLGIVTMGTATTADEALALEQAGVDCIVASGAEAGGHKGSFLAPVEDSLTGSFVLIPQIVRVVHVPVVAAGGVADAHAVVAALALGASGVQIGTAFLACEESAATPLHRTALFGRKAWQTTLSRGFTGRFARGIRNRLSDRFKDDRGDIPAYPVQAWMIGRLSSFAHALDRADLASLSAGQGAPLLHHRHAADLFEEIVRDVPRILAALSSSPVESPELAYR
jgi:nitronate monooxygenase